MDRSQGYSIVASAICAAVAGIELLRIVLDRPWPGFTPFASHFVGVGITLLCLSAALVLPLRRKRAWLTTLAWLLGILTPFALLAHGLVTRTFSHGTMSLVLVVLAFALIFCVKRMLQKPETERLRAIHDRKRPRESLLARTRSRLRA